MSDFEDENVAHGGEIDHEDEDLENPLRIIIVVNKPGSNEGEEMEERHLDGIQSFEDVNTFFDVFDETIAVPNEDHIKYEVGSDGLVVIIVDTLELRDEALKFIDDYSESSSRTAKPLAEEQLAPKKRAKTN